LLKEEAVETIRRELIPLATVVTPNIPEAEVLTERKIVNRADMEAAARTIHAMGARYVVVKGGHMEQEEESTDLLFDGSRFESFSAHRIRTTSNHGTGCTFASAIASGLAHGRTVAESVADAKVYVTHAMSEAFPVGKGHGPLNHFYQWPGWNLQD
jgi:hydroxymethylpyrimidine/phosphomethylpyrimidine kinase